MIQILVSIDSAGSTVGQAHSDALAAVSKALQVAGIGAQVSSLEPTSFNARMLPEASRVELEAFLAAG